MGIEKKLREWYGVSHFFEGEIIDSFLDFPSFLAIIRGFPEKLPRLCKKLPRFLENLRRFFQNFPRFSRKLPSFFSKSSRYPSTKKSKFGEKYSQDRKTPFLLPLYFIGPLCFTCQFVKVVKAKSANCCMCARA